MSEKLRIILKSTALVSFSILHAAITKTAVKKTNKVLFFIIWLFLSFVCDKDNLFLHKEFTNVHVA